MARRAAEREREGIDPPPPSPPPKPSLKAYNSPAKRRSDRDRSDSGSAASTPSRSTQAQAQDQAQARARARGTNRRGEYPDAYPASYAEGRLLAARRLLADLETGEPLASDSAELAELRETSRRVVAKVRAYRSAVESPPDRERRGRTRGEAIPAHERYAHYKMRGFGGMGAKTSWAK